MSLTILSVGYTLAPVGANAVGGSEQVLSHLDRALVAAGHRSVVVAPEGSEVAGTLVPVPAVEGPLSNEVRASAWSRHRDAIEAALRRWPIDLIHFHGLDFWAYRPDFAPMLATLHLPPDWYPADVFPLPEGLWVNCVSASQQRAAPADPRFLAPVPNGVPVAALTTRQTKRGFALVLARICPEKGVHLAVEAARRAGQSLLIGGQLFPYEAHERYFREEVAPRLDARRRFLGPLGFARKRRFLTAARCLLVPSLVAETSSLVAMEALACGTPVIAFGNGALPEIVEHGRTGFIVGSVAEMADAIEAAGELDPEICRSVARERFSVEAMAARYFATYETILAAAALRNTG